MENGKYCLGLTSVSFRRHSPKEILDAARSASLECIEWGSDVHAPCGDVTRLREISELQKQYGIVCSSYGTYFRLGETPIEELQHYVRAAELLGTNILRLWCAAKSGKEMSDAEKDFLFSVCKKAASIAEANGVTLCMECHKNTFTESPDDALYLMKEINSPHFRMYWQPFQWQSTDENLKNAKKIAPFVEHIHVFNWQGKKKLPLSSAVDDWCSYLEYLPAPRALLLEFMPNGSIEELTYEAGALKLIASGGATMQERKLSQS